MSEWQKFGDKTAGARKSGKKGGIYKNDTGSLALLKQDPLSKVFDINEFLGSRIFSALANGSGAKVDLVRLSGTKSEDDVYVLSHFEKNYTDMYKHMDAVLEGADKINKFARKSDGRPMLMGFREFCNKTYSKYFDKVGSNGLEKVFSASLMIGDFDVHSGNIGAVGAPAASDDMHPKMLKSANKSDHFMRIDFGCAFDNLTKSIHPNSTSKHLPGLGPTNHFRQFPKHLKNSQKFIDTLNEIADKDVKTSIQDSFKILKRAYSDETIIKWAKHAMPKYFKNINASLIEIKDIESKFIEIMQARGQSLKNYASEIALGQLALKNNNTYIIEQESLKEIIAKNPDYFDRIYEGKLNVRFRHSKYKHSSNAKDIIKQSILQIYDEKKISEALSTQLEDEFDQMNYLQLGKKFYSTNLYKDSFTYNSDYEELPEDITETTQLLGA